MSQLRLNNRDLTFNFIAFISLILIIFGTIAWMLIIPTTASEQEKMEDYYDSIGLDYEYISIPVESNIDLHGVVLIPESAKKAPEGTVPAIIHFDSINNLKEKSLNHTTSFAKMGCVVVIIEGRGYGESEGLQDFYGNEPQDVSKVIDFISAEFPIVNQTHFGASGFSYGAGVMLIAQAIESRIFASVLYQPPTNISKLFLQYRTIQFPNEIIAESTFLGGQETRDAFYWCNDTSTSNLLLIHGEKDTLIDPNDTKDLYEQVNPTHQESIQLKLRPGLSAKMTIDDPISRKYAMAWFSHYFLNYSVNLANLDTEMQYQKPFNYNPPSTDQSRILNWFGFFLIEIGAWMGFRFVIYQYQKKKENDIPSTTVFGEEINPPDPETVKMANLTREQTEALKWREHQEMLRRFGYETLVLWISSAIVGLITWALHPNAFYGIYIFIPIVSLVGFRFFRDPKELRLNKIQKTQWYFTGLGLLAAVGPILMATWLFDYNAHRTMQQVISPWKPATIFYTLIVIMMFLWSYTCIEYFARQKNKVWLLIIYGIIEVTIFIFNAFVPVLNSEASTVATLFAILSIGLGILLMGLLAMAGRKIWGNTVVGTIFIALILTLLLSGRYYYILY